MELKHKSLTLSEASFKVLDEGQGIVEMIVSVFGNKDAYNERMMPGCYTASLKKRTPKGLFMHNWEIPVAKTLVAKELAPNDPQLPSDIKQLGGLYIQAQYNLDTQRGKDAFSDIKKGIIDEFSVGYKELDSVWNKGLDCKDVLEADLYEWSSVVVGANPATAVISAKRAPLSIAGKKVFDKTKAMYLGEEAESEMTYAALCNLGYTLLWDLGRECCFGNQMSKADRIAMFVSAIEEFSELCERVMTALLTDSSTEEIVEGIQEDDEYTEMKLEVTAHAPVIAEEKSLFTTRDGRQIESEFTALSDFVARLGAKMSAIGELRAKDRKKEGRVFSTANISAMDDGMKNIRAEVDKWEQLIHPPEKSIALLLAKAKHFEKAN